MSNKNNKTDSTHQSTYFPPVVAVLGHVDHGKTTLLDAIRKSSIAAREKGGITQAIGASSVEVEHEGNKRWITFIDTPGHEAFSQMRGRGAQAADLGLLIISVADSVKPQTLESISALKESSTPYIVVLTKSDLPDTYPDKSKKDLAKEGILVEEQGGDIPVIDVSAKTGNNIAELLDLILLKHDLDQKPEASHNLSPSAPLSAIVIESKLDSRAGSKATLVVKNGTIRLREMLRVENSQFKVRSIVNTDGKNIIDATIGEAVEVFGFEKVPSVGSIITNISESIENVGSKAEKPRSKEAVYKKVEEHIGLSVILVADTQGSLEAIVNSLPSGVKIVSKKTGEVTDADILLAKSTGSLILSFNVKVKPNMITLALSEKVLVRNYEVIYELLEEVHDAQEGKLQSQMEQIYGTAKILQKFPYDKTFAFGISVVEGRVAKGDRIRIMRGDEVIGETTIKSLRIGKDPLSKVEKGKEAGTVLGASLDIQVGDMILSHS
jgi:translation initiation factor IF-2